MNNFHSFERGTFQMISLLVHLSIWSFVCCMCFLAVPEFTLFSLHPLCMSIGIVGFITEGILAFTKFRLTLSGISQAKFHWTCMLIGGLFTLVGFLSVYINKENNSKPHFVTYHGLIGIISCIALGTQICLGPVSLYHHLLKKFVPLKLIRKGHAASGILGYGMAVLAIVLATYSTWFNKKANLIFLWYPILVFVSIFTFVANHLRQKYIKQK